MAEAALVQQQQEAQEARKAATAAAAAAAASETKTREAWAQAAGVRKELGAVKRFTAQVCVCVGVCVCVCVCDSTRAIRR